MRRRTGGRRPRRSTAFVATAGADVRAALRERVRLRRAADRLVARGGHPRGCLVCLRHDGGFVSREHVVPEGAGNREVLLPPGWVCDRCNNGPLALIDAALLDFPSIALMRVLRGVPGKSDRLPEGRWSNARGYIDRARRRPTPPA